MNGMNGMGKVYTNFEPLLLVSLLFQIEAGAHGRRRIKKRAHCSMNKEYGDGTQTVRQTTRGKLITFDPKFRTQF